jgi:hypothetical protein
MRGTLASVCAFLSAACLASGLDVYIQRRPTDAEALANFTGAVHEPLYGCLLGAFIDQDATLGEPFPDDTGRRRRDPAAFEKLVGKEHAGYFFYMGYGSRLPAGWVSRLAASGKVVHIALEPNNGLEYVRDDSYLQTLADQLRKTGARVFLRFASEMNGKWVAYSGDPALYREKFRLVAKAMRRRAPNVAMVWCPYALPAGPIPSYYPGDEAVDWVGVNLYSVTYFNQDKRTPGKWTHPVDLLEPVYRQYARKKPLMIGEYGAAHYSGLEAASVAEFATGCIRSLYAALPRKYPRVKAVFYFNGNNMELEHRRNNNYAVTQDERVREAYSRSIAEPYYLSRWPSREQLVVDGVAFDIEPVNGGGGHTAPPESPMPVRDGEVLRGQVRLSVWAKDHLGKHTLRVTVGGKGVVFSQVGQGWDGTVDVSTLPAGPVEVVAEAWSGRKVVQRVRRKAVVAH